MRVRTVMTAQVQTVGPQTSAKEVAELMVQHGYAAVPVVDDDGQILGIVAEADVLRDRLAEDPRAHFSRRGEEGTPPPLLVEGVMTRDVRCVEADTDLSDVAQLVVDERLRSLPVVEGGRLVGIVSRRDLLKALLRSDEAIRDDLLDLVERYSGERDCWRIDVHDGAVTLGRTGGSPGGGPDVEERALRALAQSVGGVINVAILAPA